MLRTGSVFVIGLLLSLTVSAQTVSKFIVFGDSLSDNGNSYEFSHHTKPPDTFYYQGRYSNGPIWIDYVLNTFSKEPKNRLLNYAFGGSGVLQSHENAFTLRQEVDSYLLTHPAKAESDSWFVLWIGANDYLLRPNSTKITVNKVISEMERNLLRLQKHGAQHVIVMGLPDLGLLPFAHALDVEIQLSDIVQIHNQTLKKRMTELKTRFPKMDWHYMDVNKIFSALVTHPKQYGFVHTTQRCLEPEIKILPTSDTDRGPKAWLRTAVKRQQADRVRADCLDYVFLDQIHPTTHVHQIVAQQFVKIIK